ncbi:hypothetical protein [Erwinia aphidicola]|uniref:hypothetical protein n=1 Tax=Erwinia aphidicola TaxID=68334 RepID=UPI003D2165BA
MSDEHKRNSYSTDIILGLSLGTLTGFIVGITTASVTSAILSSMLAMVSAFVGLAAEVKVFNSGINQVRVVAFCLSMMIAMTSGIWMRTHDVLSPSPQDIYKQFYNESFNSFSEYEAKEMVLFVRYGLVPQDKKVVEKVQQSKITALFSGVPAWCGDLSARQNMPAVDLIIWLQQQGGEYRTLAERMLQLPQQRQEQIAHAALFYLCGVNV